MNVSTIRQMLRHFSLLRHVGLFIFMLSAHVPLILYAYSVPSLLSDGLDECLLLGGLALVLTGIFYHVAYRVFFKRYIRCVNCGFGLDLMGLRHHNGLCPVCARNLFHFAVQTGYAWTPIGLGHASVTSYRFEVDEGSNILKMEQAVFSKPEYEKNLRLSWSKQCEKCGNRVIETAEALCQRCQSSRVAEGLLVVVVSGAVLVWLWSLIWKAPFSKQPQWAKWFYTAASVLISVAVGHTARYLINVCQLARVSSVFKGIGCGLLSTAVLFVTTVLGGILLLRHYGLAQEYERVLFCVAGVLAVVVGVVIACRVRWEILHMKEDKSEPEN